MGFGVVEELVRILHSYSFQNVHLSVVLFSPPKRLFPEVFRDHVLICGSENLMGV